MMKNTMGYADPQYARSLNEFGEPRELPHCGGWILVRDIPGTPYRDAMGCYPLFSCRDWTKLQEDIKQVAPDLVSLSLVTDPFGPIGADYLQDHFDLVKPFKTHYVVDVGQPLKSFVGKVHRKNAYRAIEVMDIEVCFQPFIYINEWVELYDTLIRRHDLKGIHAFSPQSFKSQLEIPGMVMFVGRYKGEIVAATLVLLHHQIAYFHLSAYTKTGYEIKASYGTHWAALDFDYKLPIKHFSLGGAAGLKENARDGLAEFKKGWANNRRLVYFCGAILNQEKYDSICKGKRVPNVDYFPAYRAGEF
jgi:hypothetical protein